MNQIKSLLRGVAALLAGSLAASGAMAGFITTNEAKMDSIFSQAGFGANTIDIRFNAPLSYVRPTLVGIDSLAEWNQMTALAVPNAKTVSMFFTDSISWCGGTGSNIIGCADTPGNVLALDSDWAANPSFGGVLAAHELAHNLNLGHLSSTNNLMNPTIGSNNSFLSSAQISTLLQSPLIQFDGTRRYISITPIALIATAVPEPGSWLMMGLGLGALGVAARRGRCTAADPTVTR
ncbi:PEP-CTERM sorting domain-containing protein [Roseateles sp. DAIF2]|uniref:PEP-CTERM sorting domain-containing protein n=1 Tax=Roseateles sp. DAIF2 TaxID=2714952 RepID=UPI0018A256A7|nr:PEP-CTERM sorting domain-containing protein [Roseateles sp. DAIF2]QPF71811.1 PEP-CTERM sorting domain-containing protein [Roseateles sp. DAIF2]